MARPAHAPAPARAPVPAPAAPAHRHGAPAPAAEADHVERVPRHPDATIADLAARRRGLVTTEQLRAAGLGRGAIALRVRNGRLHPVHRGVHAVGVPAATIEALELAALLACRGEAVLAGRSAARVWRILDGAPPAVEVLVVGGHRARLDGVRCRVTGALDDRDRRCVDGVAVTAPARTLLDLAAGLGERDLRWAVEEARVRRLVSPRDLDEVLARAPGRRGAGRLRAVLADLSGAPAVTRSAAERRLHDLIRAARLPAARANVRVGAYEVDLLWPEAALIAEVDGFAFHGGRAAFERDRRRDGDLQAAGYRVVRVTWRQLTREPEAVAALLSRLLATPPVRAGAGA